MHKKICIIYDHFLPAWKAGGPVRSIAQLITEMSDDFSFYMLTSAYDHHENKILAGITADQWTNWNDKVKIYYLSDRHPTVSYIYELLKEVEPDFIFINGLFSLVFNMKSLIAAHRLCKRSKTTKIILSPRGMLHPGALSQKRYKKKLFLSCAILSGLYKNVEWHATDTKEVHFIRAHFKNARIHIAGNFPKLSNPMRRPDKNKGTLIMGTLALISPMKNHLEILYALQSVQSKIIWHIYGPVKDSAYWLRCTEAIHQLPTNIEVRYHGAIPPDDTASALRDIQVFILPSKSENFGHAIIEALSAGRPVITTDTTPFTDLTLKKAGYTLSIHTLEAELRQAILSFAEMDDTAFSVYEHHAVSYARHFVNTEKLKEQYRIMFSPVDG